MCVYVCMYVCVWFEHVCVCVCMCVCECVSVCEREREREREVTAECVWEVCHNTAKVGRPLALVHSPQNIITLRL